ncbi:MAG: sulfotransferase family protein [Actinomycetota bacterium]
MTDNLKTTWKSLKRRTQKPEPGVIGDPLPHRVELFIKRRQLHARRMWLRAAVRRKQDAPPPADPIFIIGCPRSGTTLLFRLLQSHRAVSTPVGEGHILWNTFQHPRTRNWTSDRLAAEDIKPGERPFLYAAIERMTRGGRFLDKTPRNSLRIPYLLELFPSATFVLLKRDGPPTVSSLIEGWSLRHGISYRLPENLELAEYRGRLWSYLLPAGWRDLMGTTIADVAAHQYVASYETALSDMEKVPGGSIVELTYESLVAQPVEEIERLLDFLALPHSDEVIAMASNLPAHQVQVNSPPRPDKWRERGDEIGRIFPIIAPTTQKLGYASTLDL